MLLLFEGKFQIAEDGVLKGIYKQIKTPENIKINGDCMKEFKNIKGAVTPRQTSTRASI